MGDPAPIGVVLLGPGRDGRTRGVVEVDVDVPWDVGVPKERRITGGCWGHDVGHTTSDVGTPVNDPSLGGSASVVAAEGTNWIFGVGGGGGKFCPGFMGVDCAVGLNSMVGVGGPIKCVQIIKILIANVIFQINKKTFCLIQ